MVEILHKNTKEKVVLYHSDNATTVKEALAEALKLEVKPDLRYADLRNNDLQNIDLNGVDLYGADFSGSDLRNSNFYNAKLRHTNWNLADLRFSNLIYSDLRFADLHANLCSAVLRFANLISADLSNSDLSSVDSRSADLRYTNLHSASLIRLRLEAWEVHINSTHTSIGWYYKHNSYWLNATQESVTNLFKDDKDAKIYWQEYGDLIKTKIRSLANNK